jgi:3-phenylpropionate/trans-cinnamate dioxygenase ferredoxin component
VSDSASTATFVDVAAARDVPAGKLLGVKLPDGTRVCLYNQLGSIGAVSGTCTHAEYPMELGALRADGTIECGWHGARFDCRTGAVCRPPAIDPLPIYQVRIEADRVLVGPLVNATRVAERDT